PGPGTTHTTYVASYAWHEVMWFSTDTFVAPANPPSSDPPSIQRIPVGGPPVDLLLLPGPTGQPPAPPGTEALFVAVPDNSTIVRLAIQADGSLVPEPPTGLCPPLAVCNNRSWVVPPLVPPPPPPELPGVQAPPPRPCDSERGSPPRLTPAAAPRLADPGSLNRPARPVALAWDPDRMQLLVADAALPLIHVFNLVTEQFEEPIYVGVPTRDLVVTPQLPWLLPPAPPGPGLPPPAPILHHRVAYAIDASDGSVLAVDLARKRVLRVDDRGGRASDRIPFHAVGSGTGLRLGAGGAAVLEILTPGCAPGAPACVPAVPAPVDPPPANPRRLQGVFLAVALTDGTVRIVDVQDLEAGRRCPKDPNNPDKREDAAFFQRRHLPRVDLFTSETFRGPAASSPLFELEGQSETMLPNGVTLSAAVPDLVPLGSFGVPADPLCGGTRGCPAGMMPALVSDQVCVDSDPTHRDHPVHHPLICANANPWHIGPEQWTLAYEGFLARGGRGSLSAGQLIAMDPGIDLCALGVLDATEMRKGYGAHVAKGDQLVITQPRPSWAANPEDPCSVLAPELPLAFEIVEAYRDRLVLFPELRTDLLSNEQRDLLALGSCGGSPLTSFAGIQCCFGDALVGYQIRAHESYVVKGDTAEFWHRVRAETTGRCAVDPLIHPAQTGRAFLGQPFQNFAFSLALGGSALPSPGLRVDSLGRPSSSLFVRFSVGAVPPQLGVDLTQFGPLTQRGVLPVALNYHPVDERLYVVDSAVLGLNALDLDGFEITLSVR
ncbi:MAG: hypothetical protein MJD61_02110, partial [Proteobacteria bacterium]|nr:hypothetical protein [Pseudomonadota bacterium]